MIHMVNKEVEERVFIALGLFTRDVELGIDGEASTGRVQRKRGQKGVFFRCGREFYLGGLSRVVSR